MQFANAGLVAALTVAGSAVAQTFPKEGHYDYTACWSGVSNPIQFSKTHSAVTSEFSGTTRSNPPGGYADNLSFRCVGLNTTFGGKVTNTTVCEALGADGDKILSQFSVASDGTATRETIAGTGKYEGLVSSGTTVPLGASPPAKPGTFQGCNRQTGTYKMK